MITGKDPSLHTRPCGVELFGSIPNAVPGLLLVKRVLGRDGLTWQHSGSSDLDFTPETGETEIHETHIRTFFSPVFRALKILLLVRWH